MLLNLLKFVSILDFPSFVYYTEFINICQDVAQSNVLRRAFRGIMDTY